MTNKSAVRNNAKKILTYPLADKKILWLSEHNKYLVVIPPFDEIIKRIYKDETDQEITDFCEQELGLGIEESYQILLEIKSSFEKEIYSEQECINPNNLAVEKLPEQFFVKRFYKINKQIFLIEYETAELEYFIHPKFAHLEILTVINFNHHFKLFEYENLFFLMLNGEIIGSWNHEMEHIMSGKVFMEILQKTTHTEENDWMAVFHAAGISNGTDGILFLGDSGNGKSTLSAILMANGYNVLADDFLPVESKTCYLSSFPAAISVKKFAIEMLTQKFPELKHAREYEYPAFNKTVRYLSNPNAASGAPKKVPCKALVFVKYEADSGLQINTLQKDIAFQKLVPDSWISPLENNAKYFLDWFGKMPCWQLTYSDNEAMLETVKKIFADEL